MRLAYAHFGITVPVMSVILSVFMLGLALGSWAGGKWILPATRQTGRSTLFFYGIAEALIGLGALCVPLLFSWGSNVLLTMGDMDSTNYLFFSALVILVSLLPWCFFMGATFPLVTRFIQEEDPREQKGFSFLYLANVLGACAGTLSTAFVLVELFGFHGTLVLSACLNLLIAIFSVAWSSRISAAPGRINAALAKNHISGDPVIPAFLFMSGFTSMAMEVGWVRDFTPVLGNEIYAFSGLLATYLFATGAGSWLYRRRARGKSALSLDVPTALLSLFAFLPVALIDPRGDYPHGPLVLASLVPFCAALGYLTPLLIDRWTLGNSERVGPIYAWNILGCILGPLTASYLLLPYLGAKWTLTLLALPFVFFYAKFNGLSSKASFHRIIMATGLGLFVYSGFFTHTFEEGWNLVNKVDWYQLRRDNTATVFYYRRRDETGIKINGIGATRLTTLTKMMAHLPMALCPRKPWSAMVICFGMGTTFRSLVSWGGHTTAVELVPSVPMDFGLSFADANQILSDPRNQVVIDDGRRFLSRTNQKFDVITLDPMPPVEAAGSSLLYSTGFYAAVKKRLAAGGIVHQWFPGGEDKIQEAFVRSFVVSFPYVRAFGSYKGWGTHLIGSMKPIDIPSPAQMVSRMPLSAQADLSEWMISKDLAGFLAFVLSKEVKVETLLNPDEKIVATDDRPFNEYYFLRRAFPSLFRY